MTKQLPQAPMDAETLITYLKRLGLVQQTKKDEHTFILTSAGLSAIENVVVLDAMTKRVTAVEAENAHLLRSREIAVRDYEREHRERMDAQMQLDQLRAIATRAGNAAEPQKLLEQAAAMAKKGVKSS